MDEEASSLFSCIKESKEFCGTLQQFGLRADCGIETNPLEVLHKLNLQVGLMKKNHEILLTGVL